MRQAHLEWTELKQAAIAAAQTQSGARRSARHASSSGSVVIPQKRTASSESGNDEARKPNVPPQDFIGFFASLNVNMRLVATIAQEMISFYALCDRLKEDFNPIAQSAAGHAHNTRKSGGHVVVGDTSRMTAGYDVDSKFLVQLQYRMMAMREVGIVHPASALPGPINKRLERTQGAG